MNNEIVNNLRNFRINVEEITRANIPDPTAEPPKKHEKSVLLRGLGLGILTWITLFLIEHFILSKPVAHVPLMLPNLGFVLSITTYYLLPVISPIWTTIENLKFPYRESLQVFNNDHKFLARLTLAFWIVIAINQIYAHYHFPIPFLNLNLSKPLLSKWSFFWAVILLTVPIRNVGIWASQTFMPLKSELDSKNYLPQLNIALPFRLWLGKSTGQLVKRHHVSNIAANQDISLSLNDATQNILVLGGIGSGKTTRAIHPLLVQLLDQRCGGLIFDIKSDFKNAVATFSSWVGIRPPKIIGPGNQRLNLISGLNPEIASSFLKSAFLISGQQHNESFWIDTATELCRNVLGILSFLPQHYSLCGLYAYLFDESFGDDIHEQLDKIIDKLPINEKRLLNTYLSYHTNIFATFDDKVKNGVQATIAQILAPFNHPELLDAFCSTENEQTNMEEILNGSIYLVDLPLARWGIGAKVAYTLIKLRFFNIMQQRALHADWNQENPVFFMCDEYQEIISASKDGLSDLNFWDKSRSSKTIGIISTQSVSSFYAALGNRDLANAILQNFRQRICFKTEDSHTIELLNNMIGSTDVMMQSLSKQSGKTVVPNTFSSHVATYHFSESKTFSYTEKSVINAQLVRNLKSNEAIGLFIISGSSYDDVINTIPIYI